MTSIDRPRQSPEQAYPDYEPGDFAEDRIDQIGQQLTPEEARMVRINEGLNTEGRLNRLERDYRATVAQMRETGEEWVSIAGAVVPGMEWMDTPPDPSSVYKATKDYLYRKDKAGNVYAINEHGEELIEQAAEPPEDVEEVAEIVLAPDNETINFPRKFVPNQDVLEEEFGENIQEKAGPKPLGLIKNFTETLRGTFNRTEVESSDSFTRLIQALFTLLKKLSGEEVDEPEAAEEEPEAAEESETKPKPEKPAGNTEDREANQEQALSPERRIRQESGVHEAETLAETAPVLSEEDITNARYEFIEQFSYLAQPELTEVEGEEFWNLIKTDLVPVLEEWSRLEEVLSRQYVDAAEGEPRRLANNRLWLQRDKYRSKYQITIYTTINGNPDWLQRFGRQFVDAQLQKYNDKYNNPSSRMVQLPEPDDVNE